jgi:hypothetical protein
MPISAKRNDFEASSVNDLGAVGRHFTAILLWSFHWATTGLLSRVTAPRTPLLVHSVRSRAARLGADSIFLFMKLIT